MRPSDLKPASVLGAKRPHGHKMRYMAGCRCLKCRVGNSKYKKKMAEDRKLLGPNDRVPVGAAREHLLMLQKAGMGHKTVHKHSKVSASLIGYIIWGGRRTRTHIRRRTEAKILAIQPTLELLPRLTKVPAGETVARLQQLIHWGYPKLLINCDAIGARTAGLQIHALKGTTSAVAAKTAIKVRDYFAKIVAIRDVWKKRRGRIPLRHFVYWKKGRSGESIRSLELRPFAVSYDYHYRFTPDLKDAIRLANQLQKTYRQRKKSNGKKQDG